jgi:hypothetical protein
VEGVHLVRRHGEHQAVADGRRWEVCRGAPFGQRLFGGAGYRVQAVESPA